MRSKVFLACIAMSVPWLAAAQQPAGTGVQAQGNASAQGGASAQRSPDGAALQSQSGAAGSGSATVSKGDEAATTDGAATTNAVLSSSLDAKKAKPGDPVTAKTTEPTSTPEHGKIPRGTKLLGRVTEARAAGSGESQSVLAFTFDRAVLKDGREVPFRATLRALAAAHGAADMAHGSDSMHGSGSGMHGGGGVGGISSVAGGVGTTAGGALGSTVGGAGRVTGSATGALASSAGGSVGALKGSAGAVGGLNGRGMLKPDSQGAFGIPGVELTKSASGAGSVVTSAGRNVRLESGTRMLLSVGASAAQPAADSPSQP
jgi:hypothetical protein